MTHLSRPGFSEPQLLQAQNVGEVTDEHRRKRRQIPSYPIDNVGPEVVADRDDGVYVETEHRGDGGYRVHVTIADVAAHVGIGSPLAQAAWQRAFTLYGGSWTDPMFPNGPLEKLEEKMSLEHNRERLGLTVSITLDKNFKPVHTSFLPVITHPDNSSYQQAHERMLHDPQFQLMADIAEGVKKHHFHGLAVPLDEIFSRRTLRRLQNSPEQMQAMEMVATYMLLANNCTAEFARKSELPFLYRNFDEAASDTHATYSTKPKRHTALERMGLKGAYCHFTSPIRRAPDYFNAVMIHHAIDALDLVEQRLRAEFRGINAKELHHNVWGQGAELLKLLNDADKHPIRQRAAIQQLLTGIVKETLIPGQPFSDNRMRAAVAGMVIKPAPLSTEQLQGYADHMNALARSPDIRAVERQNEKYDQSVERIENVQAIDKESLAHLSREKFSSYLHAAAVTGDIPRNLFEEARKRIESGNYNMGVDGFTIFIEAAHASASRWTALKGLIATDLKKDPSAVNTMRAQLEQYLAPAEITEAKSALHGDTPEGGDKPSRIEVRLLRMQIPGLPTMAAPFYSVGHDDRAALSHATYSFLEHYAFAQLQPVEQTAVPSILYAELEVEDAKKRELLDRMAESIGAKVELHATETKTGRIIQTITVKGGELDEPITIEADEPTNKEALDTALRRMLRDERFKLAVSRDQQIASEMLNPQALLEEMVKKRGGEIKFERQPKTQGPHGATITVTYGDGSFVKFKDEGPNLDRAERAAAVKGLQAMGWQMDEVTHNAAVKSWATENLRAPAGEGRQYHGK